MKVKSAIGQIIISTLPLWGQAASFQGRWFGQSSPWNAALPENAKPTTFSTSAVNSYRSRAQGINLNRDVWTPAVIYAPVATRKQDLSLHKWLMRGVPVPEAAFVAVDFFRERKDTDASLCIYSEEHRRFYSVWAATRPEGGEKLFIQAGASNGIGGPGWWDNSLGPWIGRASGASYCGGLIRPREIEGGVIKHALAAGWPQGLIRKSTLEDSIVYPATTTDGTGTDETTALPMGSRIQLDPKLSDEAMTSLGLTHNDLIVAHALQHYGAYVVDSSSIFCIYFASGLGQGGVIYPGFSPSLPKSLLGHIRIVNAPPPRVPLDNRTNTPDIAPSLK